MHCTTTLFAFHGWSDQCLYFQWWTGDLNKNLPNSAPIEALFCGTYLFRPPTATKRRHWKNKAKGDPLPYKPHFYCVESCIKIIAAKAII